MIKYFVTAFVLCMVLLGKTSLAQEYTQSYSDDLYQFHLSLPNTKWNFFDLSQGRDPVKVKVNYHQAIDQFVPNITLSVSDITDDSLSFECIVEKAIADYAGKLTINKQKIFKLGGRKVAELNLTAPSLDLIFLQRLILKDKQLYVLTYSAKSNSFERFAGDAKKIFDSLIFIAKEQKSL